MFKGTVSDYVRPCKDAAIYPINNGPLEKILILLNINVEKVGHAAAPGPVACPSRSARPRKCLDLT